MTRLARSGLEFVRRGVAKTKDMAYSKTRMDARYTGRFPTHAAQARAETVAYYQAQQAAAQRQALARAYLAQEAAKEQRPGSHPAKKEYRCERCGI